MIGFGTKDYSKHAWSSRLAAPSIKIDWIVQCRDLPKKDLLSQADSFCVLWQVPNGYARKVTNGVPSKLPWAQEIEKGKTEVARGAVHPTFNSKFRLEFTFHEEQTYVIRVYNEDLRYSTDLKEHDYLGGCVFSLGQLMGTKGCSLAKRLERGKAYMIVTAEGKFFAGRNYYFATSPLPRSRAIRLAHTQLHLKVQEAMRQVFSSDRCEI